MTTEQAYIEGFVKRASEYGLSEAEAVELLKESSTRYMRELREGTPAGKQIESEMISRMGKNNTDLIKNNPKGINLLSDKAPNVNPELSEALLRGLDARATKEPSIKSLYGDLSREEIARLEAGAHIRDMSKSYVKGTNPNTNAAYAMYGPQERMPGHLQETGRQSTIRHLADRAKRRAGANIPENVIDERIFQANRSNAHNRFMREKVRDAAASKAQQAAYGAAKGMKEVIHPSSGLLNKLKSLLRKK